MKRMAVKVDCYDVLYRQFAVRAAVKAKTEKFQQKLVTRHIRS